MTVYYCGSGGSDANNGLTWANRKLTLNGCEDVPLVAGDTVYVAPGVYREMLIVDVSGSSGNPITYIGDITGEHTDGVGGAVRITGSNNDQTATREYCFRGASRSYRTFRGFAFDTSTGAHIYAETLSDNWIVEDCCFQATSNAALCYFNGAPTNNIVRRCAFLFNRGNFLQFAHSSAVNDSANLVENCLFVGGQNISIRIDRVGGIAVKNCTFLSMANGVRVMTALTTGQTTTVNNCIFSTSSSSAVQGFTNPATNEEITEDYNTFWNCSTNRSNVTTGSNSVDYPPLFQMPLLVSGYRYPWQLAELSSGSMVRAITGSGEASDSVFGIARPATSSKKSWGATQYPDVARETTTVRTGSASIKLADAGRHQMFVPTTNTSTTISVYVQWEADYAGTKPQLVVKQPGQSDSTDTATGSSGSWEQLSVTLTPAASPGYVVVELVSNNTATSGNYDVFWDDLVVA